jgi:UDP-glucose 4-epimerase
VRDYIHVTDLAQAHIMALDALESGGGSAVYNLGNEQGHSVREVIDVARRVTGVDIPFVVGPRREGDPAVLVASSAGIQRELGWRPRLGGLEMIIASAWKWHSRYPDGYGD